MATPKKRKALTLETKISILNEVEKGQSPKKDIAKKFDIPQSTLSTILKNKETLREAYEGSESSPARKKFRSAAYSEVEDALFEWFKSQRSQNVPLSGPILLKKANDLAQKLGIEFTASSSWIDRFKQRKGIVFRSICGESAVVNMETVSEWRTTKLPELLSQYAPRDVFNADETGLFYKAMPNRTLQLKGEKCHGGKLSKERITVLPVVNMDGSEKLKLFVIGKFQNPRCFKNVKSLPVEYHANKKAWMTGELFTNSIRKLDKTMKKQGRKILMLVDNCAAHPKIQTLENVKLAFLPPNTTSVLQPMDQGIIYNLKFRYRQKLIRRYIECLEKKSDPSINLLTAIRLINASWREVTPTCIRNFYAKAGFVAPIDNPDAASDGDSDDDDDVPLCDLRALWRQSDCSDATFNDYVEVDSEIVTSRAMSDDEIVSAVKERYDSESSQDEDTEASDDGEPATGPPPSYDRARGYIDGLVRYLEATDNVTDDYFNGLLKLGQFIDQAHVRDKRQSTIKDFFTGVSRV